MIEHVATECGGDLRAALHSLQFNAVGVTKQNGKEVAGIGIRDSNVSLFSALGKILYNKRTEEPCPYSHQVESSTTARATRFSLAFNPERVVEASGMEAGFFTQFLHENYPPHYGTLDGILSAAEWVSVGDLYLKLHLYAYTTSTTSRGLLLSHPTGVESSEKGTFRSISKP